MQAWAPPSPGDPEKILTVPLRVGIDFVTVDSVRESLDAHGEHYLERVYTAREREDRAADTGLTELALSITHEGGFGVGWRDREFRFRNRRYDPMRDT